MANFLNRQNKKVKEDAETQELRNLVAMQDQEKLAARTQRAANRTTKLKRERRLAKEASIEKAETLDAKFNRISQNPILDAISDVAGIFDPEQNKEKIQQDLDKNLIQFRLKNKEFGREIQGIKDDLLPTQQRAANSQALADLQNKQQGHNKSSRQEERTVEQAKLTRNSAAVQLQVQKMQKNELVRAEKLSQIQLGGRDSVEAAWEAGEIQPFEYQSLINKVESQDVLTAQIGLAKQKAGADKDAALVAAGKTYLATQNPEQKQVLLDEMLKTGTQIIDVGGTKVTFNALSLSMEGDKQIKEFTASSILENINAQSQNQLGQSMAERNMPGVDMADPETFINAPVAVQASLGEYDKLQMAIKESFDPEVRKNLDARGKAILKSVNVLAVEEFVLSNPSNPDTARVYASTGLIPVGQESNIVVQNLTERTGSIFYDSLNGTIQQKIKSGKRGSNFSMAAEELGTQLAAVLANPDNEDLPKTAVKMATNEAGRTAIEYALTAVPGGEKIQRILNDPKGGLSTNGKFDDAKLMLALDYLGIRDEFLDILETEGADNFSESLNPNSMGKLALMKTITGSNNFNVGATAQFNSDITKLRGINTESMVEAFGGRADFTEEDSMSWFEGILQKSKLQSKDAAKFKSGDMTRKEFLRNQQANLDAVNAQVDQTKKQEMIKQQIAEMNRILEAMRED